MMLTKKFVLAALATTLFAAEAVAYDFVSEGVYYNVLSNTATRKTAAVTYLTTTPDQSGYISTYKGDVVIPAEVSYNLTAFKVTQIGDLAMFNNQGLYTLKLPEGITSIGSQAFSHCYSMYEITIPSTVSRIADYAFEYCEDLTSISLPKALADFGDGVFQQCYGLEEITVDAANEEYVSEEGALYSGKISKNGRYLVAYPGGRQVADFTIPDDVRSIDSYAFSANSFLQNLTLGKAVSRIPVLSFSECAALESIEVADGNESYKSDNGVLLTADGTELIQYPVARPDSEYIVPEGVTTLGMASFNQAFYIANLTLPSTLRLVEELAFFLVQSIENVTCNATTPPQFQVSTIYPSVGLFDSQVYRNATLWVPAEAVDAYKAHSEWGKFSKILAIGSSSVESVETDQADSAECFDIAGRRITRPVPGALTIIKRGSETVKVLSR